MSCSADLVYREDYFNNPAGWSAIRDLLADIFGIDISPLARFGGPPRVSMPSAYFDAAGRCVANLSAFAMPLLIDGKRVEAAGLQSGAVRPEYRGRGLFRALTSRTLQRCDEAGFDIVVLYTDKPDLYRRHGFRTLPQHHFAGFAPQASLSVSAARPLEISDPTDIALLRQLLAVRTPVSDRFSVLGQAEMFLLNAHLLDSVRLHVLADGRAVIAWRDPGEDRFELLDIVGSRIPPLAEIRGALSATASKVTVHFPPDRLEWDGVPEQEAGDLVFMVRDPQGIVPDAPFCLSPMAEF
ncbi:GNAT family N-acetyltransferase [Sinorhizobium sp. BG8]|uniref:GNAT family N-acetyltransferase n=1 Tax=Sinorhizobium sp. BG8 TaxID=2613773 RepID=UPI00193CD0D8|nr:GNAT family N-acetyltransferase [Sinorhizobium sp. BG8]QRM53987.1 GNAT family N-acetyltransferase [Sinorhizobium sp. BG8]